MLSNFLAVSAVCSPKCRCGIIYVAGITREMLVLMMLFALFQQPLKPSAEVVLESTLSEIEWVPEARISPEWASTRAVSATKDFYGHPVSLPPTEIRSRWTSHNLYLLYVCPYSQLYLKPSPVLREETDKLWNWDVAEAFIGTDFQHIGRYKEFEVSPQGEYVDLDIDRDDAKNQQGIAWQSGFAVSARIDPAKKIWYGEMRIPFASLGLNTPKAGDELRLGLFRIEGAEPKRIYVTWSPTGSKSFHVPAAFGRLILK